jgi:phosphonate transport system substrate-binding protein
LVVIIFISGCNPINTEVQETPTIARPTATLHPTRIPTTYPLGTSENPIIIAHLVESNSDSIQNLGKPLMDTLMQSTNLEIQYLVYDDPKQAFSDLRNAKIHFIWLQPLTYLAAYQRDLIYPLFVTNHYGIYKYGTQFLANKSSGYVQYFDPASNQNTTSEEFALTQFDGDRPCWTDPSSLSGTIVPFGILSKNGIQFLPPTYLISHSSVVRALYIKGICDFGATFAYSGDPRTSSQVISDLPDALDQIEILWQSDPIIPSLSFNASQQLPQDIIEKIADSLFQVSKQEDGPALITESLNYDVQGLMSIDNDFYDPLKELVQAANIVPFQHLGY